MEWINEHIGIVALAAYEFIVRITPTVKSYTIVGRLFKALGKLSKWLDNIKP